MSTSSMPLSFLSVLTDPNFLVFAPATLVPLAAIFGFFWSRIRRAELEAALKKEMIQQGMSADDIVKVLQAPGRRARGRAPATGADGSPVVYRREERIQNHG